MCHRQELRPVFEKSRLQSYAHLHGCVIECRGANFWVGMRIIRVSWIFLFASLFAVYIWYKRIMSAEPKTESIVVPNLQLASDRCTLQATFFPYCWIQSKQSKYGILMHSFKNNGFLKVCIESTEFEWCGCFSFCGSGGLFQEWIRYRFYNIKDYMRQRQERLGNEGKPGLRKNKSFD